MIVSETLSFKFGVVKHLLKELEENAVDNWTYQNHLFLYHDEFVRIKSQLASIIHTNCRIIFLTVICQIKILMIRVIMMISMMISMIKHCHDDLLGDVFAAR